MKYDTLLKFCMGELEAKRYEQPLTLIDLSRTIDDAVAMLKPQVLLSISLAFLHFPVQSRKSSVDVLLRDNIKDMLQYDLATYLKATQAQQVA